MSSHSTDTESIGSDTSDLDEVVDVTTEPATVSRYIVKDPAGEIRSDTDDIFAALKAMKGRPSGWKLFRKEDNVLLSYTSNVQIKNLPK